MLCEGGWTGPRPQGLPDVDPQQDLAVRTSTPLGETIPRRLPPKLDSAPTTDEGAQPESRSTPSAGLASDSYVSHPGLIQRHSEGQISRPPSSLGQTSSSDRDALPTDRKMRPSASLGTLASFPNPPTHFPIPPVMTPTGHKPSPSFSGQPLSPTTAMSPRQMPTPPSSHRTPATAFSTLPSVVESPAREAQTPGIAFPMPQTPLTERPLFSGIPIREEPLPIQDIAQAELFRPEQRSISPTKELASHDRSQASTSSASGSRPLPTPKRSAQPVTPLSTGHSSANTAALPRGDYLPEATDISEGAPFGSHGSGDVNKAVHRSDSQQSRGSAVAAMRGKFTHSVSGGPC